MTKPDELFSDSLLEEIGLAHLDTVDRCRFFGQLREDFELRVGTRLSAGLTEPQRDEFEYLTEGGPQYARNWLDAHVPDYLSRPIYRRLVNQHPELSTEQVLTEAAALEWMNLHQLDPQSAVEDAATELRAELIATFNNPPRQAGPAR